MSRTSAARRCLVAFVALLAACDAPVGTLSNAPASLLPQQAMESMDDVGPSAPSTTAIPAPTFANVAYATRSSAQRLDLYLPKAGTGPFPLVIWIHGGGWRTGNRSLTNFPTVLNLLNQGIAVASIDYRLSQEATFPAQIHDVKAAIRFLRGNATRYRLNPNRFGAWGASAGGHLATLAGTSVGVTALTDLTLGHATQSERLSAVADLFGPLSFRQLDPQLSAMGCPPYAGVGHAHPSSPPSQLVGAPINSVPAKVAQADPLTWLNTGDAALFIQHGTSDCQVPYAQSTTLRNAAVSKLGSANVTYQLMPGYKHGDSRFYSSTNVATIASFFKAKL